MYFDSSKIYANSISMIDINIPFEILEKAFDCSPFGSLVHCK